ncbi:WD40-repeat-containing domain protein [Baffinella frigidus]|nr:WD40-repeat-containing domain protein [Cryptophyta sp. CCMP2293]
MSYTDETFRKLKVARVMSDSDDQEVTSLDFTPDGSQLLTASNDHGLRVYDCGDQGILKKTLFARKFGISLARFMHDPSTVVCASNNEHSDFALRYWTLHDNRFLRYFKGHRAKVTSLHVCPKDDQIVSAAHDGTIRLWDVRQEDSTGFIRLANNFKPSVAFDNKGLVFAATINENDINLYSTNDPTAGPFQTISHPKIGLVDKMKFSADGTYLILSGASSVVYLVDTYAQTNSVTREYEFMGGNAVINDACLTPDGAYVIGGTSTGVVAVWETMAKPKGKEHLEDPDLIGERIYDTVAMIENRHLSGINCVQCSPATLLVATSCRNLNLWLPEL